MSGDFRTFYIRMIIAAASFVLAVSAGIYAATKRRDLVVKYCIAHIVALVLGTLTDLALVQWVLPKGGLAPAYMNAIFLAPIVFFVGFSIYLCHWKTALTAWDILIPIMPIVIWGALVVFGWQRGMGDYDVLGAWFVSAGCGGVDLAAVYGPPSLAKRPLAVKAAGYALMLASVYLILPRATS